MVQPPLARGPSVSLTHQVAGDVTSSFLFENLDPCKPVEGRFARSEGGTFPSVR